MRGSSIRYNGCVRGDLTHQVDAVHDADTKGHERLGEVNHLFTLCCDGQACDCQVCFLQQDK